MAEKWIQKADKKMEENGTKGAFGKATPSKIAAAKKEGGLQEKRAVFAENMKKIAAKHDRGGKATGHSRETARKPTRTMHKSDGRFTSHSAIGSHPGYTMGMKNNKKK